MPIELHFGEIVQNVIVKYSFVSIKFKKEGIHQFHRFRWSIAMNQIQIYTLVIAILGVLHGPGTQALLIKIFGKNKNAPLL